MEPTESPSAPQTGVSGSRPQGRHLFLLAGLGTAAGAAFFAVGLAPRPVDATPTPPCYADDDCDGLPNLVELQFGSSPTSSDTDLDGRPDFEEWILRTDPASPTPPNIASLAPPHAVRVFSQVVPSFPEPSLRIGIAAYAGDGDLGWLGQLQLVGMVGSDMEGTLIPLRGLALAAPQGIELTPGSQPGSLIGRLSFGAPLSFFLSFAPFSIAGGVPSGSQSERDSVYFDRIGSVLGYYSIKALPDPAGGGVTAAQAAFTPVDQGGTPSGWGSFGNACVLTMESGGSTGPYVLVEITEAGCQNFPAYCDAGGCAQKLGTTHFILDVLGVIGSGN